METDILQHLRRVAGHGYMRLVIGIILVLTGIWVFLAPEGKDLSKAFAWTFLLISMIEICFAALNAKRFSRWGWLLAGGMADLLTGGSLLFHPMIYMTLLPAIVSFIVLLRSLMALIWYAELGKRNAMQGRIMLAAGSLGIIMAIILFFNPVTAGLRFVQGTAASFVIIGILEIYLSVCLKKQTSARI